MEPINRRLETATFLHMGYGKESQQDRLLVRNTGPFTDFFAIIDGLGGQPGGKEAAETALAVFKSFTPADGDRSAQLHQLLLQANEAIIARGDTEPALYNMGATATLLLITENRAHWAHIGDCRLYHVHGQRVSQITADQNLAGEMFDRGEISEAERQNHKLNHFLSQCLGEDDIEPARGSFPLAATDTLLLCSDGIHDMIDRETINGILSRNAPPEELARRLADSALQAGGKDNIGIVLIRFSG